MLGSWILLTPLSAGRYSQREGVFVRAVTKGRTFPGRIRGAGFKKKEDSMSCRVSRWSKAIASAAIVVAVGISGSNPPVMAGQTQPASLSAEPACQTLTMTSVGGDAPRDPSTLIIRWLGAANFELAYRDSVVLLDAYYDRSPRTRPLGFAREDITRATAIFVGHGHSDHMSDAPYVAGRTGARVFGGPPTTEAAIKLGLPTAQAVTVKGGEVHRFNGFTVEAVLARHSDVTQVRAYMNIFGPAFRGALELEPPFTEEEKRHADEIRQRGTSDPRVLTEGTIAYLFTFDGGFRFLFLDSAGELTDGVRNVMQRIGSTDIASVAYQGMGLPRYQVPVTMPLIKAFNPAYFIPNHHDEIAGQFSDMATYPLFMAIRDELPRTKLIDPLYRTPICFNTMTKEVFVGGEGEGGVGRQSSR